MGIPEKRVIVRLHRNLPGTDVLTLERMGLARRSLRTQLQQLDAMYSSTRDTDVEMAHQNLEVAVRSQNETAVAFGRRLMTLASAAARGATPQQMDALAQCAYVRGYNCPTVIPELRKTRRNLGDDCRMRDLVKTAEQTEVDYGINREMMEDQPSDVKPVRLVTPAVAAPTPVMPGRPDAQRGTQQRLLGY